MRRIIAGTEPGAWLLILSSFVASVPVGFLNVALPIYLDRIGLHPELIGTLYTISGMASAILLVAFGLLADRYGRKWFVVAGTALPVASYVILALTTARLPILVASAVGGIGLAGGMSGALTASGFNALLAEKTSPEVRTTLFAFAEMGWSAAVLVGALLAELPALLTGRMGLSYRVAYHDLFIAILIVGLLAALVLLPLRERHSIATARPQWLPRRSGGRIALLSVSLATLGLGLGFIVQLLPLWFHRHFGVDEGFLGPPYAISQIAAVCSLVVAAPLSRRFGPVPFVAVAQAFSSLALVSMAFAPSAGIAAVGLVLRSAGMNPSWPVQQAFIMDVVDPGERATAASLTLAAWSVAGALTPPLGGALLAGHHDSAPFLLSGVCYAVSIAVFVIFFRHLRPAIRTRPAEETGTA